MQSGQSGQSNSKPDILQVTIFYSLQLIGAMMLLREMHMKLQIGQLNYYIESIRCTVQMEP